MNKVRFEDIIERDGKLTYTNVGTSMEPLIRQGRDLIVINKPTGRLKRYDIALFRRKSGQYVLHRVLWARKKNYVFCGDNQTRKEHGITDDQIIGVMSARIRDGKKLMMNSAKSRIYAHLWCDFFWIRVILLKAKRVVRKVAKRRK